MFLNKKITEQIGEYVANGHPDKVADQLSDALLDAFIAKQKNVRAAIECLLTADYIIIAGEVSDKSLLSREEIIDVLRAAFARAGYGQGSFNYSMANIIININQQSPEIARSIDSSGYGAIVGAGDQCMVCGFATNETSSYMPSPIHFAKAIIANVMSAVKTRSIPFTLGPDGKSQVVIRYRGSVPTGVSHALLSIQHPEGVGIGAIKEAVLPYIVSAFPAHWKVKPDCVMVNPSGSFVLGGPAADCGLTGRKTIVDSYGASYYSGGGAFSGKDPSKMDRSGAYMARYIAKNIVASGLANSCGVTLGYAIGISRPVFLKIENTGAVLTEKETIELITERVPLTPHGIVEYLGLQRPIYARTALQGHFGIEPDSDGGYSWERLDLADTLVRARGKENKALRILPLAGGRIGARTIANNAKTDNA